MSWTFHRSRDLDQGKSEHRDLFPSAKTSCLKRSDRFQALPDKSRPKKRCFHGEKLTANIKYSRSRIVLFRFQVKALSADLAVANQDKSRHEKALSNLRYV